MSGRSAEQQAREYESFGPVQSSAINPSLQQASIPPQGESSFDLGPLVASWLLSSLVPDDPALRRNFVPDDPTEDPNFDPSKWTGTFLSGLISSRYECGVCGVEWVDGHECAGAVQ